MIHVAHRGNIDQENTIAGIKDALNCFEVVEIDVRYNTNRDIVLCHDREKRNTNDSGKKLDLLEDLCNMKEPMSLMIDIKAFGTENAKQLAKDVVYCICRYTQHTYRLCSFNEYCVQQLIDMKLCSKSYLSPYTYSIGVISSGIPLGLFGHMFMLDFISLSYDVIHEEVIDLLRKKHGKKVQIFAWTVNDPNLKDEMENRYKIDGLIYDWSKI
jgi:glycerophosphoryl diester phosphodiesterase